MSTTPRRSRLSAGLLLYRRRNGRLEVFLAHPGGPFWASKDAGAWSIPKGEVAADEDPLATALREFHEETGFQPGGDPFLLGSVRQKGGKEVMAWALEGDVDAAAARSNEVEIEIPRGSGRWVRIPEVDRFEWFPVAEARGRINPAQVALLERLSALASGAEG